MARLASKAPASGGGEQFPLRDCKAEVGEKDNSNSNSNSNSSSNSNGNIDNNSNCFFTDTGTIVHFPQR